MAFNIVRWWLVLELFGLVGLPLSVWLFRRLPEHGLAWSKALGLLLTGWGTWLLASFGFGSFSFGLITFAALLVTAVGLWACRRSQISLRAVVREQRWWWAFTTALFVVVLVGSLVIRWQAPWGSGIGHTETPMDFAFLNGILASQSMPPQDPWLAGYPINYYYFGYLLIGMLTRIAQLPSAVSFSLALPTIWALCAVGIAGIVWNATGLRPRQPSDQTDPTMLPPAPPARPWGRLVAATVGVVLVLFMGNQMPPLMFLTGTQQVTSFDGSELVSAVRQSLAGEPQITFTTPTPRMDEWGGQLSVVERKPGKQLGDFFWWPSRAVWDTTTQSDGSAVRRYAITEFPLFSLVLGDMHPHVLALPWTLLALALALNLFSRDRAPEFLQSKSGRLELLISGVILGSLYAINSWDLPTYLLLYLFALVLLYVWLAGTPRQIVWPHLAIQAAVVVVACYALWLPFYLSFVPLVVGEGLPLRFAPARTGLHAFLVIFGLFFVPLLALLVQQTGLLLRKLPQAMPVLGIVQSARRSALPNISVSWPVLTTLAAVAGFLFGWQLFWLLPLAGWALYAAYHADERAASVALVVLALGAMVVWGTDVVYLPDVFNNRMNTIFKFYYQVWVLWGVGASIACWLLLRRVRALSLVWTLPFGLLLLGGSFYLLLAPNWSAKPERTVNGLIDYERGLPAEMAAITWIQSNVPGNAVILEAPGGGYNSRMGLVSMITGRQQVVGWGGHESQWRGGQAEVLGQLGQREAEAKTIYTSFDVEEAQPLLDKYKVQYVFVGANERQLVNDAAVGDATLAKFATFMEKVYDQDGVIIYKRR